MKIKIIFLFYFTFSFLMAMEVDQTKLIKEFEEICKNPNYDHLDEIKRLMMDEGLSYNAKNEKEATLLMIAIKFNQEGIITYLLDEDLIDLTAQDSKKNNVLHHICRKKDVPNWLGSTFEFLLKKYEELGKIKSIINEENKDGLTPLGLALLNGNEKMISTLNKKGAFLKFFNNKSRPTMFLKNLCSKIKNRLNNQNS